MSAQPRAEVYTEALLDAMPARNAAVRAERRGQALVLWIPIQRRWWTEVVAWAFPLRGQKGFALDVLGEEVWEACDGEHKVEDIIEGFAARHQVRFHDARVSVLQFLRTLIQRNLVALVTDRAGRAPGEERRS